jgi:osmotically inducible protein OsmC
MNVLEKVLYTAHATAIGGREGTGKTSDGLLDVKLTPPKEMGGAGTGVNPEHLFAVGYAACFIGAIKAVAGKEKIAVPADVKIDSSVSIGTITHGYGIAVELKITIPGMDKAQAQALVDKAHQVCPYSNATRGNVDVKLTVL